MEGWLSVQRIADVYGIEISMLSKWVNNNVITYTVIGGDILIDENSLILTLNHNKVLNDMSAYLDNELKCRKEEIDRLISEHDDLLYQFKSIKQILPAYKIICYELSELIIDPLKRAVFLELIIGKQSKDITKKHNLTFSRLTQLIDSAVNCVKAKGPHIAGYRKRLMQSQFKVAAYETIIEAYKRAQNFRGKKFDVELPADSPDFVTIFLNQSVFILFYDEVRILNVLISNDIDTIRDLMMFGKRLGFKTLCNFPHFGHTSLHILITKLKNVGLIDDVYQENSKYYKYL